MARTIRYGIKHDNGKILAISEFGDNLLAGFVEVTKEEYDEFINLYSQSPYYKYDSDKNELVKDNQAELAVTNSRIKGSQRDKLRELSVEIDLKERLNEPTADTQAEFDNLKADYNGS